MVTKGYQKGVYDRVTLGIRGSLARFISANAARETCDAGLGEASASHMELGPSFVDDVEWRLRCPAETAECSRGHYVANA